MKLFMLPCLLEEDCCRFKTIKLELSQAKEILEMHMKHVHGRPDSNYRCDDCDRDTNFSDDKEIIEDDKEVTRDANNEALYDAPEQLDERKASTAVYENVSYQKDDIAEVTSVTDDRDYDKKHFEEVQQEILEAENDEVEEIFKSFGDEVITEPVPSCRNCGSPDHTSQRKIRRRHCPAWNIYCTMCNKRGHLESCCDVDKITTNDV